MASEQALMCFIASVLTETASVDIYWFDIYLLLPWDAGKGRRCLWHMRKRLFIEHLPSWEVPFLVWFAPGWQGGGGRAFVQGQGVALCGGAPGQGFQGGENLILARQTDHTQSSCLSTSARALLYTSLLGSSWNGISGTKLMCFTGKDNLFFLSSPNALFKIICDKKWTPPLWFSHHPWGLWALPPSVLLCWSCAEKPDNIKYLDFPIKNVHPAMFVTRDCWRKPWVRCCGCAECRNGQNSVTPVLLGLCVVPLEWEWLC